MWVPLNAIYNFNRKEAVKLAKSRTDMSAPIEMGRPATTPEAREDQMIDLAVTLVERRLRDGSASSQETTHYLKLASRKSRLENEKLKEELALIKAKTEAIQSSKKVEELYADAIKAFKTYSGQEDSDDQNVF